MEPTIFSEDVILTEHISPRFNRIQRGDVIIARSPTNPHHHICKRVTGVGGDKVKNGYRIHIVSTPSLSLVSGFDWKWMDACLDTDDEFDYLLNFFVKIYSLNPNTEGAPSTILTYVQIGLF